MSKSWSLTWIQKRDWELGDVEVKPCKKKEEFYSSEMPAILYKSPYKYNLRIGGSAKKTKIQPAFKLLYSDSGEAVKGKSFEITDKKPTVHSSGTKKKPLFEKMISFSICSYKHSGRSFRLTLSILDDKGVVCRFSSSPFVVKAKKPIANPGIKSSRKRKRTPKRKRKSRSTTPKKKVKKKPKQNGLKPKRKKRRKNSYKPKPGDEKTITIQEATLQRMMRPPPRISLLDSPVSGDEEGGKRTRYTRKTRVSPPPKDTGSLHKSSTVHVKNEIVAETERMLNRTFEDTGRNGYFQTEDISVSKKKKKKKKASSFKGKKGGLLGGGRFGDYYGISGDEYTKESSNKKKYDQFPDHRYFPAREPVPSYQTVHTTTMTISEPGWYPVTTAYVYPGVSTYPFLTQTVTRTEQHVYQPPPPPPPKIQIQIQKPKFQQPIYLSSEDQNELIKGANTLEMYEKNSKNKEIAEDELVSLLDPHDELDYSNYQEFDGFGPIKDLNPEQNFIYF